MPFSFKIDNPVAKIGVFIVVPIVMILLGYNILSQTCCAPKPEASTQVETIIVTPDGK